jgi:hypothetical protein
MFFSESGEQNPNTESELNSCATEVRKIETNYHAFSIAIPHTPGYP